MIERLSIYKAPAESLSPYRNLAREEWFLSTVEKGEILLYLWQNQNTVVIGRNQNSYQECRTSLLEQEGGHLARRLSGGGAVFHDLGNLNFTFITSRGDFDVGRQTSVIEQAVKAFGIEASQTGRNDITVGNRKFSGNAYYLTTENCYQHGTLLVAVDPEKIGRYLNVSRAKLESKGVRSVRSRVCGLSEFSPEITIAGLKEAITDAFSRVYGLAVQEFAPERMDDAELKKLTEKYASPSWVYGEKLPYTYEISNRFGWGSVTVQAVVSQRVIKRCRVYSDALDTDIFPRLEKSLTGRILSPQAVKTALRGAAKTVQEQVIEQDIRQMLLDSL